MEITFSISIKLGSLHLFTSCFWPMGGAFEVCHIVRYSFIVGHVVVASYWNPGGWLNCGQVKSLVACTMYGASKQNLRSEGESKYMYSFCTNYLHPETRTFIGSYVISAFCENILADRVSMKHIIKFTRYNFSILINFIFNVIHIQTNHP